MDRSRSVMCRFGESVPLSFGTFQGLRNFGSFQTGSHINPDAFYAADGFSKCGFLSAPAQRWLICITGFSICGPRELDAALPSAPP